MNTPSARASFAHRRLTGQLKAGSAVPATTVATVVIPVAGANKVRIRAKVSGAATILRCRYLMPDGKTEYAANHPADVNLADGVENKSDFAPNGEGMMKVEVVGHATIDTIANYVDVMALVTG